MPKTKGVVLRTGLQEQLEARPDVSLEEICQLWETERGVRMSTSTMSRAIHRLGWT
jgi:transposase